MLMIIKKITQFTLRRKSWHLLHEDKYGNKYYLNKRSGKRICEYNGVPEPTKVPPEWHSWLHYSRDEPSLHQLDFMLPHIPNTAGTHLEYRYPITSEGSMFGVSKSHYIPWKAK